MRVESVRVTEFPPSITTTCATLDFRVTSLPVIAAVEYIAGEPVPLVVYVPPVTLIVPPPLSDLIAADEPLAVVIVRLLASIVPPPVTMIPPELFLLVVMTASEIVIVVPSPELLVFMLELPPYANTAFPPTAFEEIVVPDPEIVTFAPPFARIAAFVPYQS